MASENDSTESPFNLWWWLSAGFLVLLAVVATVVFVTSGRPGEPAAQSETRSEAAQPEPTAATASATTPAGEAGGCGLAADSQDIPVAGPEAVWTPTGLFMVPTSPEHGPEASQSSGWTCFAHSPTGALFAAAHFTAGAIGPDYASFMADAAIQNAALETWLSSQDPDAHRQEPGRVAQIAGYEFLEVSPADEVRPNRVAVNLGLRQSSVEAAFRVEMVWDESAGTWKGDMTGTQFEPTVIELAAVTAWGAAGNG